MIDCQYLLRIILVQLPSLLHPCRQVVITITGLPTNLTNLSAAVVDTTGAAAAADVLSVLRLGPPCAAATGSNATLPSEAATAAMALADCGRAAISLLLAPQPAPCAARLLLSAVGAVGGAVRAEAALTYAAACDYDALCGGGRVVDLLRVRATATPRCDTAVCVDPLAAPDPAVVFVTPTCGPEQGGTVVEVRD